MYKASRSDNQHRVIYISFLLVKEGPTQMRRHFSSAGINFKAHLVPNEYSSFDHFPKSNLPNENIKVT